jgi:hypothetical protein
MVVTMRAPKVGGFEYIGRMIFFSCERTAAFSSADAVTTDVTPARSP